MKKLSEDIVFVSEFVDLVGPETEMLGPVKDGGRIVTGTEPACYGPMITPEVESGHTISRPVAVAGAEVGDGVALRIKKIKITSKASASGTETPREGSFVGDPFVAKKCPGCGKVNPNTVVKGVGRDAICCADCDTSIMDMDEVKNRLTITGGIEIGRLPGIVHICMLTPISRLEQIGIAHLVKERYGL